MRGYGLQLRTSCYQCLAGLVVGVLAEVLDEAGSQILGLLFPLASAVVSVTRIEDSGVHIGQRGGNLEVEHRNLLGLSLQNGTIENGVDDATCVGDRDTLASGVQACVHQICLGTAILDII